MVVFVSENNKIYSHVADEWLACIRSLSVDIRSDRQIGCEDDYFLMSQEAEELILVRLHRDENEGETLPLLKNWYEASRKLYWVEDKIGANISVVRYTRKPSVLKMSVVLSTCNQPAWLEKVLWGYEAQDSKDFELIVADDGSRKETYDMLQRVVPQLSYQVKHVWHEDKGFRKCDILNKGILAVQTDYLLFSDGDCIPRKDFVSTHLSLRRKGRFLSGGYHKLSMDLSKYLSKDDILSGRCFDLDWMREKGMPASFKNNKLTATGWKRWALNTFTPTKPTWNGHNASGWLSDILAVNGFDERMQYGGQDREFGERLENYGIHGMQIRYSTVCLHLDHARGYKTPESIQKNRNIRKHTRGAKVQWSPYGILKEEIAGKMVRANSWYDRYTIEEEQLAICRERGGFYKHIYSLPCQWRIAGLHRKIVQEYMKIEEAPVLSGRQRIIVSLTTFPPRVSQLSYMLKSILWQTCLPDKIIVWLSEDEFPGKMNDLPAELKKWVDNGVEYRFVSGNLRSHKKYYYVFQEYPDDIVITVDDDLIYPRDTIERLLSLSYQYPNTVCCNVVRKIHMAGTRFTAYKQWKKVITMPVNSSLKYVAIGCGGIYYPPHWYGRSLFDRETMGKYCLAADDLWLKANELKEGIMVTGGGNFYPRPIELPKTQHISLQKKNNGKVNLNDEQWEALNRLWGLDQIILKD